MSNTTPLSIVPVVEIYKMMDKLYQEVSDVLGNSIVSEYVYNNHVSIVVRFASDAVVCVVYDLGYSSREIRVMFDCRKEYFGTDETITFPPNELYAVYLLLVAMRVHLTHIGK